MLMMTVEVHPVVFDDLISVNGRFVVSVFTIDAEYFLCQFWPTKAQLVMADRRLR